MNGSVTWRVLLLIVWMGMSGCHKPPAPKTWPSVLARHWVSVSHPDTHGLLFRADGTGVMDGADPTSPGPPIRWYAQSGKLFVQFYGEEGEYGPFEPHTFTLSGDRLTIEPAMLLEKNYVLKR